MGVLRVERASNSEWLAQRGSGAWQRFDIQLTFYAVTLAVIGLLMAYSNSSGPPLTPGSTFTRGLIWFAVAIVVFTVAAAFDTRWLRTFAWLIYLINIALLAATLAIGTGVGGVSRWVSIFGLQFQFSEVAKILMIGVLAAYLAGRKDSVSSLRTAVGAGLLVAPPFALVLIQPDLGTSLVFAGILLGMLFMIGTKLRWLTLGAIVVVAAMPVIWSLLADYQRRRLLSFLDPASDPLGSGFQLIQSQMAVGSGGLLGTGLDSGSTGAAALLPVQTTDFAAAVLFQELGFVGGLVIFALFVALIWRVLLAGWRSQDVFGVAFAAGVASMLLFQLVVNVGMVIGVMPVTGIPLPFITHGGASLISIALGLGILQSLNMRRERPDW